MLDSDLASSSITLYCYRELGAKPDRESRGRGFGTLQKHLSLSCIKFSAFANLLMVLHINEACILLPCVPNGGNIKL